MALQPQNERPFGFRDKLGYLFGDFGNDFTFIFAGSYLTLFYTDVLGVSAGLVGVLFVVARCVDAFTDVGMGRLVDTLPPSRGGRFRPWILRVCVPVALASVLMYLYFARSWPYAGKVAYMFATYIFWGSICYTAINIPYGSMASVLSADAGERASLSTFRSVGAMLANLIIAAATPLFLFRTAADGTQTVIPERFTLIAVVYGVCAVACYLLCYALCRERVQAAPPREAKRQSFASLAKALAGNRALTAVIGAALLLLLASLLGQGMNMYLFKDYFNSADMLSLVGFAGVLPMLALIVCHSLLAYLAMRSEKVRIWLCGEPTVLIRHGVICEKEMRRTAMTLNDLMAMLRVGGVQDPAQVETAVLETGGSVSVFPKAQARPATPADLQLTPDPEGLPLPLILDGEVQSHNLTRAGLTASWLAEQVKALGYGSHGEVFFLCVSPSGQLICQGKGRAEMQQLQALTAQQARW